MLDAVAGMDAVGVDEAGGTEEESLFEDELVDGAAGVLIEASGRRST